jgi:hypothetical protein
MDLHVVTGFIPIFFLLHSQTPAYATQLTYATLILKVKKKKNSVLKLPTKE